MAVATTGTWTCQCGRTNAATWRICPGCERSRLSVTMAARADRTRSTGAMPRTVGALTSVLLVLTGALVGVGGWQLVHSQFLSGDRAATLDEFNGRTPPPPAQSQAYEALGKRLVVPGRPYRVSNSLVGGPVTPEALAEAEGEVTGGELRARGLLRGYAQTWETPDQRSQLVVLLEEFRDNKGMTDRVAAHVQSLAAAYGSASRAFAPRLAGAQGLTTTAAVDGSYATAVVTSSSNRIATLTLLTEKPPTARERAFLLRLVRLQDARL